MSKGKGYAFSGTKGDIVNTIQTLPPKPDKNFLKAWNDGTSPEVRKNTPDTFYKHKATGLKVRFDPATLGAPKFNCNDHWHVYNPNKTSKLDKYLDEDGNPVKRDSNPSRKIQKGSLDNMTIREFGDRYYFHDSSIEKVEFDADKKILKLTIEFCFWMQEWYDKSEPKNGLILVTFENVSRFEYDESIAGRIFSDELDSEIRRNSFDDDGALIFVSVETVDFSDDAEDIYYTLKVNAANVEVEELERYTL